MTTEQYSYDAHLREEDGQLFHHDPRSWSKKHLRARDDIIRDLKRHGYIDYDDLQHTDGGLYFYGTDTGEIIDDSEVATGTLQFTATSDGSLTVPKGTRVFNADPGTQDNRYGAIIFETDAKLTVAAGSSDTVPATAEHPGEPYNVPAGALAHLDTDLTHFDSVTNPQPTTGGADHQLARLSVYRALTLIYRDLVSSADDTFDYKRRLYGGEYDDELERMIASGIKIDLDGDGEVDEAEEDLEHGSVRLQRS